MKLTVFGIGYVGLVQAAIFANVGHTVCCVDIDEQKIENLKKGLIPIYEPGLEPLIERNLEEGRLYFTTSASEGVEHGDVIFIAVGTPPGEDGSADLKYVLKVAESIAENIKTPKVIVNKSTVPVGTGDRVQKYIASILKENNVEIPFDVVSNPEFFKEGAAVQDCIKPDRIIIGATKEESIEIMREVYAPFSRNHDKIIVMDLRSAELTKYAANCILATKISFMNEIAALAEKLGADIEKVRQGIGSDPRIGFDFIYPGCGYGGSCFPKDVKALIKTASEVGYPSNVLSSVQLVNERQKECLFHKLNTYYEGNLEGKVIALWGLAFKPNTDDMRESPSRNLVEALFDAGAKVQAFDPKAMNEAQKLYGSETLFHLMGTKEAALKEADALVICTEWQDFRSPDFEFIKSALKEPLVFDGRNIYDPERMQKRGFKYYGIGRGLSVKGVLASFQKV